MGEHQVAGIDYGTGAGRAATYKGKPVRSPSVEVLSSSSYLSEELRDYYTQRLLKRLKQRLPLSASTSTTVTVLG